MFVALPAKICRGWWYNVGKLLWFTDFIQLKQLYKLKRNHYKLTWILTISFWLRHCDWFVCKGKLIFVWSPCWRHLSGHCGPRFHLLEFLGSLGVSNYWFYRHWLLCIKDLYGAWAGMVSSRLGVLYLDPISVSDSVFKEISFFWADRKCLLSWIIIDFLHVVRWNVHYMLFSPETPWHVPTASAVCYIQDTIPLFLSKYRFFKTDLTVRFELIQRWQRQIMGIKLLKHFVVQPLTELGNVLACKLWLDLSFCWQLAVHFAPD